MTYKQEEIRPYNDTESKGAQVERMFDGIAHSYDLLNHTLSLGIDKQLSLIHISEPTRPY